MISGHFDQIRSTETEELQTQSDDDEDKKEALEEMARQLEEKDRELEDLRKAKQDAEIEKDEKMAKSEALDSALGESSTLLREFVCSEQFNFGTYIRIIYFGS